MTTEAVYQLLKTHQRPYNVNDIINKIPKQIPKANVQHALDALVKMQKVFVKVNSKQKIYCIVQDPKKDAYELMRIDRELQTHAAELNVKLERLEKEVKTRETDLKALKSALTLAEATAERDKFKATVQALQEKLQELKKASGLGDEKNKLVKSRKDEQKKLTGYTREYSKRKRICSEILDSILEAYPGTKKGLYDEIGIDTTQIVTAPSK